MRCTKLVILLLLIEIVNNMLHDSCNVKIILLLLSNCKMVL